VVRAHDLGEWEGLFYLTMEYIKGVSVADLLLTRGRLTTESTCAVGTQVAEALTVAHEQGIIHRDIKPQNLMVDDTGVLKVMDFGLARLAERSPGLTQAGLVVGTPRYMAPEQLLGGDVDARTDLFAMGVVLYECLTGQPPFDASSPAAVMAQMLQGEFLPVRALVPDCHPVLASLVERLLHRDPGERPQTAREVSERLSWIGEGATT
jgi:serine/threonine protein kinase